MSNLADAVFEVVQGEDPQVALATLREVANCIEESTGRSRKAIRREVGKRLRAEGLRIIASYCAPRAVGRRYKIRIVKLDMREKALWGAKAELPLSDSDVARATSIINTLVPVPVHFWFSGKWTLVAIWQM